MLKVCITGATGFIGKNLLSSLKQYDDIEIIALSRKISPMMDGASKGNIVWKRCNGFSLLDVEKATEGVDILVYLIHSMVPSSSLSQGKFSDFDLFLADNFAKAAKKNGVKKIIYLSGFIPEDEKLSAHLQSRLEVEKALAQYDNNLSVLRAGLIVGRNGSSFRILERLIRRLPVLICPSWTLSKTQPIDLKDVLASLVYCLRQPDQNPSISDIGGPDIMTYKEMLHSTALILNKKRPIFNVPVFSPSLSKLWVSKVTSASPQLVYPLVESLKHNMIADPKKQLILKNHTYTSFKESLKKGINPHEEGFVHRIINYNANINLHWLENVTSIQRIPNPLGHSAEYAAIQYFSWLPQFLKTFINIEKINNQVNFYLSSKILLLRLEKKMERSTKTRVLYYIKGGILARDNTLNGRLEFRNIPCSQDILISLLDFRPSLPWFIYKYTQALIHIFTMNYFHRHWVKKFTC
ncbi:MAG: NAD(P)H-binding protein [Oligoflexales bacterium]